MRLLFAVVLVVLALRLAALGRGLLGDVWGTRLTAGAVRGRRWAYAWRRTRMEHLGTHVAAHEATLAQMNGRLTRIEARLSAIESRLLYVGGALAILMSLYQFL